MPATARAPKNPILWRDFCAASRASRQYCDDRPPGAGAWLGLSGAERIHPGDCRLVCLHACGVGYISVEIMREVIGAFHARVRHLARKLLGHAIGDVLIAGARCDEDRRKRREVIGGEGPGRDRAFVGGFVEPHEVEPRPFMLARIDVQCVPERLWPRGWSSTALYDALYLAEGDLR